jgi:hypothetical protein
MIDCGPPETGDQEITNTLLVGSGRLWRVSVVAGRDSRTRVPILTALESWSGVNGTARD